MTSVWVIDTETSNTGIWHPEPGGHIVEFGAVSVDLDRGKLGRSYSAVVYDPHADPNAWVFMNTSLTYSQVMKGVNAEDFGNFMAKHLTGQTVTAYNVAFDKLMIGRDMPSINKNVTWGPCLMDRASHIDGIPKKHAGSNQFPTAEASYNYLCPDDPCGLGGHERHRALDDARMEAHIMLRLHELGLYDLEED